MVQAHGHLGYAPQGAGLLYAVLWFSHHDDVFGWFIGARQGEPLAAYFKIEDYHTPAGGRFLRSAQDDIYGPWIEATGQGDIALPHLGPVPEDLCHELVQLQDHFIRHWLFFADDPEAGEQAAALRTRGLTVRAVNVRADRLDKFDTSADEWRYDAPGADTGVLIRLSQRWPLDHRLEFES
jgi:hypothetical protein